MQNQCRSQKRSYVSCLQTSCNLYALIQTCSGGKKAIDQPTKAKSCPKHQTLESGRKSWRMHSGQMCSGQRRGTWSSEFLGTDTITIKAESQQFFFGQSAAVEYVS